MTATPSLAVLTAEEAVPPLPALRELLHDAVVSGASFGFLPPLTDAETGDYRRGVVATPRDGVRALLAARGTAGSLVGTVQLDLPTRTNDRHRAEVAKLLVHHRARRQGIGRVLLRALEATARDPAHHPRSSTRATASPPAASTRRSATLASAASRRYARSVAGTLRVTAFHYKLLVPGKGNTMTSDE